MKISILEEKPNPFLRRKELRVEISHPSSATPSKEELRRELARLKGVEEEKIRIDYIFSKKGKGESFAKVKIQE